MKLSTSATRLAVNPVLQGLRSCCGGSDFLKGRLRGYFLGKRAIDWYGTMINKIRYRTIDWTGLSHSYFPNLSQNCVMTAVGIFPSERNLAAYFCNDLKIAQARAIVQLDNEKSSESRRVRTQPLGVNRIDGHRALQCPLYLWNDRLRKTRLPCRQGRGCVGIPFDLQLGLGDASLLRGRCRVSCRNSAL